VSSITSTLFVIVFSAISTPVLAPVAVKATIFLMIVPNNFTIFPIKGPNIFVIFCDNVSKLPKTLIPNNGKTNKSRIILG